MSERETSALINWGLCVMRAKSVAFAQQVATTRNVFVTFTLAANDGDPEFTDAHV
jgi:hypothetical protein